MSNFRAFIGFVLACSTVIGAPVLASTSAATNVTAANANSALFESKIRPLLLSSCVSCHGKDAPQGGLRLDVALPPGKADLVLQRVRGEGGKPRMPLGGQLSKENIDLLESWIRAGAPWSASQVIAAPSLMEKGKHHWSFQPLVSPAVPKSSLPDWTKNPIDAFVLARLRARGLRPSPTASRRELIRRLTYDLTGLPPSPEEVAAFEANAKPDAYDRLVDRLLDSPHYGEKWGRHWLDLVRYAETNSYERDNPKPNVYKYRDYIIRAFNADKPYDRFVREQIAGDEMPDKDADAIIATGYYRLGIWDDEPADLNQAEFDDLDDLVATTGQAFLGLTVDCARCHDHKLDPIPQKDYYKLLSFFKNINRFKNGGPTDEAVCFATPLEREQYTKQMADIESRRTANSAQLSEMENAFRKQRHQIMRAADLSKLQYRYFEGAWETIPKFDSLKPIVQGSVSDGFLTLGMRRRNENFGLVFDATLNVPATGDYTFYLDSDDGSRLTVGGKVVVEKNSTGGQGNERGGTVHLTAGPAPLRVDYFQGGSEFGLSVAWGGPGFARRPLSELASCSALGLPSLMAKELPLVLGQGSAEKYAQLAKTKAELAAETPTAAMALTVTEAGPQAPDTFTLKRGNPADPADKVVPGFLVCVGGGDAVFAPPKGTNTSGRRTALANWLASPQNPLTARVIVNRIWEWNFGRGIVRTPNDFGLQGAPPTHPELLDWLAKKFIEQGWSIKKLNRLIVTSNTYKQSTQANPKGLSADPGNDLFWRFDMRRLDAEEVRDSVLDVAGDINLAMFGPSIYPEVPKEILAGEAKPGDDWYTDRMKPEDLNRRSIYIHVKRSVIYPLLAAFDLPETDRSNPLRFTSTQPTQALSMINGLFANKQAAVLRDRVNKEVGDDKTVFAARLFSLVLQRKPTPHEVAEGVALMDRLISRGAKPETAQTYLCLMALNLNEFMYLD